METKKKHSQIHYTRVESTGTKWIVSEQQRDAVRNSSKILGGIIPAKRRKQA